MLQLPLNNVRWNGIFLSQHSVRRPYYRAVTIQMMVLDRGIQLWAVDHEDPPLDYAAR